MKFQNDNSHCSLGAKRQAVWVSGTTQPLPSSSPAKSVHIVNEVNEKQSCYDMFWPSLLSLNSQHNIYYVILIERAATSWGMQEYTENTTYIKIKIWIVVFLSVKR